MNRKWLTFSLMVIGTVFSSSASLQFTNITVALFPGFTNRLDAVAYGGVSNFVAVGDHTAYVAGNFVPAQPFIVGSNWTTNTITNSRASGSNLTAVASSGNFFLASGDNNLVFGSTNGVAWSTNFSKVFLSTARAAGIAYNNSNFVTVATAPFIGYTNAGASFRTNWLLASLNGNNFGFESYRGVTAIGSNGFAVCGFFGLVRLSKDSGASWQKVIGLVGNPDLYGIASDNATTLVCVGVTNAATENPAMSGIILASTNNGVLWRVAYANPTNNTPLNSVAYTGSGFIAVGKSGLILTSSNGLAWTQVPVTWANTVSANGLDLNGVAFSTTNLMKGVGELVGVKGNVILCAEPPLAPISLGNQWTCVGSAATLQVSITNSAVTNAVVVDWYDAATGGSQLASTTNNFAPPIQTANVNSTNHYWAQARDLRTGFISTNRTDLVLTNYMRPTSDVVTTNTICNGSSAVIQINFLTGNSPWKVTWTDGFTNYMQIVTNTSGTLPYTSYFFVNPTNVFPNNSTNHIYWVSNLVDAYCAGDEPGDLSGIGLIIINPRPTATLVTTNVICSGGSTVLQANLTGIGPWIVTWSDGAVQTNNTSPALYMVSPTNPFLNAFITNYYTVMGVSNADTCIGNQPGDITGTNLVIVNPRPTATLLSFNATNCNDGTPFPLTNILTGIGPWIVTWNDGIMQTNGGVGSGPVMLTRTAYPTNTPFANAPSNNIYYVTSVSNADTCDGNQPGDIKGTNISTINPRPTATLVTTNTICNGDSTMLQANLTGIGPWTVNWTDGFNNYMQAVNVNAAGPYMDTLTISNGVFNPTNVFPNQPTNHYYRVMSVFDANCVAESGDITGTNLVIVNPRPTATLLSFNATNCNDGTPFPLTNILTGIGPWIVTWNDGIMQTNGGVGSGPVMLTRTAYPTNTPFANAPSNNIYYVTSVSNADTCDGNQPGDIKGTNISTINPRPTSVLWSFSTTNCNDGTSHMLTNVLTGIGPWTNVWSLDGQPYVQVVGVAGMPGPYTNSLQVYPTNSLGANAASNNVYYVMAVTNGDTCSGNEDGDIVGVVTNTVNPLPMAPSAGSGSLTNCAGVTNPPLSVIVAAGDTANWYDTNGNLVASGPAVYVPTNNVPGVWQYFATEVNPNGCESATNIEVDLALLACTNPPIISLVGTNGTVEWFGNLTLQSTTNLSPPVMWMNVTNPSPFVGTNIWYWTNGVPPINFFRLSPTN